MKIQWLGVQGTLSSGISDVDTTISSAGLSDLPEIVAPDYAKIVIDPAGSSGRPEVVYVTAHAASSTTATVSRGEEEVDGGSPARSHASGAVWYHAATPEDFSAVGVLASGTYTPTLTTTANVSSSIVQDCRYIRMGSQVFVSGRVSITPTSSGVATRWRITLPVASNIGADNDLAGSGAGDQTDESAVNIRGDSTNDAAQFECAPTSTAQHLYAFTFGYTVI